MLISHLSPVNPGEHTHENDPNWLTHTSAFIQGLLSHSSLCRKIHEKGLLHWSILLQNWSGTNVANIRKSQGILSCKNAVKCCSIRILRQISDKLIQLKCDFTPGEIGLYELKHNKNVFHCSSVSISKQVVCALRKCSQFLLFLIGVKRIKILNLQWIRLRYLNISALSLTIFRPWSQFRCYIFNFTHIVLK